MLFSVNNDYLLKDYFNLNKNRNNILSPREGLIIGNLFYNEYDQYKNYKPNEIRTTNERERDLLKIRELAFAVNDLNLALDVEPNNAEYYKLFKMYASELNDCVKKYSDKYDALELCDDLKGQYTWYKSPWPWEGEHYV